MLKPIINKSKVYSEKLFSIVVPVYNTSEWLPHCLDSVSNQSCDDFELILVNDGSTDDSGEICNQYLDSHDNVMVIHKENGGLVSARNIGVQEANGKYICPLDSDDWINRDYIKCLKWILNNFHDYKTQKIDMIIFAHNTIYSEKTERHIPIDSVGIMDRNYLEKEVFPTIFKLWSFLSAWSIVCETELLRAHLCKNETIQMHEDFAYTYELFYNANNVFVTQKTLYYYNKMNETSITHINGLSKNFLSRLRSIIYIYNNMKECEQYIKNQLCSSFALIMIYDFYDAKSFNDVKKFKDSLTDEHRENVYVATAIILSLLNKDIKYKNWIKLACLLLLTRHYRTLYFILKRSNKRGYQKLIK